jgi:MFS family permease
VLRRYSARLAGERPLFAGDALKRCSARLAGELPLFAGIAIGWHLLRARGRAFTPMRFPAGFDWSEYLPASWMMVHRIDVGFPRFRNPLYPWIAGHLGERLGDYPWAAVVLSSIGMCLVVLAAGLGARALSTAWAGGVAAASVPLVHSAAQASRWVNEYPLLAGVTGLTFAFGACAARWPGWAWTTAAGLAAGLAWGIDDRSIPAVAAAALLVAIGAARRSGSIRWILPVLFLAGAALGPLSIRTLSIAPKLEPRAQLRAQRENALRGIRDSHIPALVQACATEPLYGLPSIPALRRPCARALLRENLRTAPLELPFGLRLTLLALPFALLPARRGVGSVLASIAVFGAALSSLAVMALWVMVPDRYILHFAAPLAMIVPVALSRLLETAAPRAVAGWLVPPAPVLAGVWAFAGVNHGRPPAPLDDAPQSQALGAMLETLRARVGPSDTLLDCSAMGLETALLPRQYHAAPLNLYGNDMRRCIEWLDAPERRTGARWLVTTVRCPFAPPPPGSPEARRIETCMACTPVPGPSIELPCPHGVQVRACPIGLPRDVPTDRWERIATGYSGWSCLNTLVLWRWKGGG